MGTTKSKGEVALRYVVQSAAGSDTAL